jgi:hypothetical protein
VIKQSPNKGRGIFAKRDITAGTLVSKEVSYHKSILQYILIIEMVLEILYA